MENYVLTWSCRCRTVTQFEDCYIVLRHVFLIEPPVIRIKFNLVALFTEVRVHNVNAL